MAHTEPAGHGGYERTDIRYSGPFWLGMAVLVLIVVGVVLAWLTFAVLAERSARAEKALPALERDGARREPPQPRLLMSPRQELERSRKAEAALLDGYAWVDRQGGIVRIPVERAIEVLAERGLPSREKGE
jgi:hypothetical protein